MVNSFVEIPKAVDPYLRRWMLFVDGENFTIRGQKYARDKGVRLEEGSEYCPNVFLWMPGVKPTVALTNTRIVPLQVQPNAIRSYYYTK